jgi:hypothetical protein
MANTIAAPSLLLSNPSHPAVTVTSTPLPALAHTPASDRSNNTFLMSASPVRSRRSAVDGYKPKMISTIGAKPACLVNASVTYVGDDQIYAFGGFDQYTDEGKQLSIPRCTDWWNWEGVLSGIKTPLTLSSIQPRATAEPHNSAMEPRRQLWRYSRRTDG